MTVMISLSRKRILKHTSRLVWVMSALLFLSTPVLISCGSKKPRVVTTKKRRDRVRQSNRLTAAVSNTSRIEREAVNDSKIYAAEEGNTIESVAIAEARTYLGTRWKYAGNDKRGMDCSGLINTSFKAAGVKVPRTTWSLKEATSEIKIDDVVKGDLLFFATGSNKRRLNHVGLVVNVTPAEIQFIHASTSRGVIISSLNEPFWLGSYLSAGKLEDF